MYRRPQRGSDRRARRGEAVREALAGLALAAAAGLLAAALSAAVSARAQSADPQAPALGSLPTSPPRVQSIHYVGKTTTNDFRGPGMGRHLQYFPAFGLEERTEGLATDCEACRESTPDFENFKHHVPGDLIDRTFSPDALGDPVGVKTAGGAPGWDVFVLPDGTVGRSGTTVDAAACGGTNNSVNQIRLNSPNLEAFCLHLITDNTAGQHDPDLRLEARSDDVDLSLAGHPDLVFDGVTDVYTFRYMGMREGDRIKIRLAAGDAGCAGPGLGGIMVSHISTCTPAPGTCTPDCGDRRCGDDGCGGSCGVCPRVDKLRDRTGRVTADVVEGGVTTSATDSAVESVVVVSDLLQAVIDELETELSVEARNAFVAAANEQGLDVRNWGLWLTRWMILSLTARADGDSDLLLRLGPVDLSAKLKPENDFAAGIGTKAKVNVTVGEMRLRARWEPIAGTFSEVSGEALDVSVRVDVDSFLDFGIRQVVEEVAGLFGQPSLERYLEDVLGSELEQQLQSLLDDLDGEVDDLRLPIAGVVPAQLEIGGVDHAARIRRALAEPAPGQVSSIEYDATSPVLVSGSDPIVREDHPRLIARVGDAFTLRAAVRTSRFPPIHAGVEDPGWNDEGDYAVTGWVCAEDLTSPLEVGLFTDGHAITIARADLDSEPGVAALCSLPDEGGYRFALSASAAALGRTNAWSNRVSVIAGLAGFEQEIGEPPLAGVEAWLPAHVPPGGYTFSDHPARLFAADLDGDGRRDLLWERLGWWVAHSTGAGFTLPSLWLGNDVPPAGQTFPSGAGRQFVDDFDGDGRADLLWEWRGWWLARSTGAGFAPPALWMPYHTPDSGYTFPDNAARQVVADFDGDGLPDYAWERIGWWVARSNGAGFDPPSRWLPARMANGSYAFSDNDARQLFADFDGDGRTDLLFERSGWWLARSNGAGFDEPLLWLEPATAAGGSTFSDSPERHLAVDLNGDGRADYLWENHGWWVALSTGDGFAPPSRWLEARVAPAGLTVPSDPERLFVADFDADGRFDLLWESGGWWIARSEGDRFGRPKRWLPAHHDVAGWTFPSSTRRHFVADFTGDGLPDAVWESAGWWRASTLLPAPAAAPPPPRPPGGC